MKQKAFLTLVSLVALAVGTMALALPATLLESKGVLPDAATQIWVRQTGLLILATGLSTYLVRAHPDSATLRSLLLCNAALQAGILPIELGAHFQGTIPRLSSVLPNSIFHLFSGLGFLYFGLRMRSRLSASSVR